MRAGLEAWAASLDDTPTWCVLSVELQLQAARDPVFASHYRTLWETQRDSVAHIVGMLFAKLGWVPPAPLRDLAANFMALVHGIALQRISALATSVPPTSAVTMRFLRGCSHKALMLLMNQNHDSVRFYGLYRMGAAAYHNAYRKHSHGEHQWIIDILVVALSKYRRSV